MDYFDQYELSYELSNAQSEEEENFIKKRWGFDRKIDKQNTVTNDEILQLFQENSKEIE